MKWVLALGLVGVGGVAWGQTTTKICVPIVNSAGASSCQDVTTAYPLPISSTAAAGTVVPLDVSTVTTGGVAVTALAAGNRTAGGWLYNPTEATINLCINEVGTASGTVSSGSLTCIVPGQSYTLAASALAVSVVSSDSAHAFSGYGKK